MRLKDMKSAEMSRGSAWPRACLEADFYCLGLGLGG